eukprot:COSAG06_NODE_10275_length_1713_cov_2.664808_1_plen_132_part_00
MRPEGMISRLSVDVGSAQAAGQLADSSSSSGGGGGGGLAEPYTTMYMQTAAAAAGRDSLPVTPLAGHTICPPPEQPVPEVPVRVVFFEVDGVCHPAGTCKNQKKKQQQKDSFDQENTISCCQDTLGTKHET